MTSGPMPSPERTAMWSALLADMEDSLELRSVVGASWFETRGFAALLTMRVFDLILRSAHLCASRRMRPVRLKTLRRQNRPPNQPALLQVDERFIGPGERHRRHRDRRDLPGTHEIEQFGRLAEIADITALNRDRLDRNQRQGPRRAAAEQADDDELAALGQAVEPKLRGLGIADQIDHRADRLAGRLDHLFQGIGRAAVDDRKRPGFRRRRALLRIDVDDDGALASHR